MMNYESCSPENAPDLIAVKLTGRLDYDTSESLLACVAGHTDAGYRKIVLDCTELEFVTSNGLGVMVRINARLKKLGGKIAIAGAKGIVAEVLKISHLDRLFNVYPTVHEAVEALR